MVSKVFYDRLALAPLSFLQFYLVFLGLRCLGIWQCKISQASQNC